MSRKDYLTSIENRRLRIYARKNGVCILSRYTKAQIVSAILAAGK